MEIRHLEQFRLAVFQPLGSCETLALRAVTVTARVVGDALMPAIAALLNMTAERGGAATIDRRHGMPLRRRQRRAVLLTESRAEAAEHIRHFQPLAGHVRAVRRARGPAPVVSSPATRPADWQWRRPCWWR